MIVQFSSQCTVHACMYQNFSDLAVVYGSQTARSRGLRLVTLHSICGYYEELENKRNEAIDTLSLAR